MKNEVALALRDVRSMLGTTGRNIMESGQPGARAIDVSLKVDAVGGTDTYRTSVVNLRRDDPTKTKMLFSAITTASKTETIAKFLKEVQSSVGHPSDPHKSVISDAVTQFIAQSKGLAASGDTASRRVFVDKGIALASSLNNALEKVKFLKTQADQDLGSGIESLNNTISELHILNQAIMTSRSPQLLHDQRDRLIQDISKKLAVKVFFGHNGVARVITKANGYELVTEGAKAVLAYKCASSDEIAIGEIADITATTYNNDGVEMLAEMPILGGKDNPAVKGISGGQIEALVDLRDKHLKTAEETIKNLSSQIAKAVNDIHNDGSSWPPKQELTARKLFYRDQLLALQGVTSFYALDVQGRQLSGNAGSFNPASIDFDKLRGSGFGGKPRLSEILTELNQKLSISPTRDRVAIGTILGSQSVPVKDQYLINNMQLAGVSGINEDGSWSFDLDLQGNSYFGSKVEVLAVSTSAGETLDPAALPQAFYLEKGVDTRTSLPITIHGFSPAVATMDVTVRVRVTGDNGVVREGEVTYKVDRDNAKLNSRTPYTSGQAGAQPNGGFVFSPAITSNPAVAKAMLVDEMGNEIDPANGSSLGRLIIRTNSQDYAIVAQGGNFSGYFGLNDFFEYDEDTGMLQVNPEIDQNVLNLATGMVKQTDGLEVTAQIGQNKAKTELQFAANFQAGDVITIDGKTFTFGVGANQIAIGANLLGSLQNLLNQMNLTPDFQSKFDVQISGTDKLVITSKTPGTWGNNIQFRVVLGGGNTVVVNNGGAVTDTGLINFIGGSDTEQTITLSNYTIGSTSYELMQKLQDLSKNPITFAGEGLMQGAFRCTLQEFASLTSGMLSQQYNRADTDSQVDINVLDALDRELKDAFAPDQYSEYYRSLELTELMKSIAVYNKMVSSTTMEIQDILFN